MLRVVLLTTSYPELPVTDRGAFVERLANGLAQRGVKVAVVAPGVLRRTIEGRTDRPDVHYVPVGGIRIGSIATGSSGILPSLQRRPWLAYQIPLLLWRLGRMLDRIEAELSPHVIHAHWLFPAGWVAARRTRTSSTPIVCTAHGSDVRLASRFKPFRSIARFVCGTAARTLAVSDEVRRVLKQLVGPSASICLLPLGVDPSEPETSPRQAGSPDAAKRSALNVLFVGRLVKGKSADTLLRALAELDPPTPVKCVLVGGGPLEGQLRDLAERLGIHESVELVGSEPNAQVLARMRECDVLVLPSRAEGRPTVVLEAMASGRPVVATAIPGTEELVVSGETGLLFPVGDHRALAQHLRTLYYDQGLRIRMGRAALQRLQTLGLTLAASVDRHLEVYHSVRSRDRSLSAGRD